MTPATRTRSRSRPESPYVDQARLLTLQGMLCQHLDELFSALGVRVSKGGKVWTGPCPVHCGDNPSGLNVYVKGEDVPGYWRCNTARCHETFRRTILGLVRGVLSRERGWRSLRDRNERAAQPVAGWKETVDWCCKLLGVDIGSIEVDEASLEKQRFAAEVARFTRLPPLPGQGASRHDVRRWLDIPAQYFLGRGFSREVLDRYDVGAYRPGGRPLSGRVAVPVYDRDYKAVVGFTGRSVHERCGACSRFHPAGVACPSREDREGFARTAKWYNHGLQKEDHLYNYWFAREEVRGTRTAVLVEGPGCCWRLEEAGVHNSLALFGSELSDRQQVLLEMSGAMDVVVLTDADDAGEMARESLRRKLGRSFRLHFPKLPAKDVGEMTTGEVKEILLPQFPMSRRV